jgi:hypothetical protein
LLYIPFQILSFNRQQQQQQQAVQSSRLRIGFKAIMLGICRAYIAIKKKERGDGLEGHMTHIDSQQKNNKKHLTHEILLPFVAVSCLLSFL